MYLIKFLIVALSIIGITTVSAKEYIEISLYNAINRYHKREITTIGLNGEYRFLKKSTFITQYGYDGYYIKGVGLFESKLDKDKSEEYLLYRNLIYSLSKKEFNNREGLEKMVMIYNKDGYEYKYKVNISNASSSDIQANKLNDWFKKESRSMILDQSMIFKAGVLMRSNMNLRNNKVYIKLFIENPSEQDIEMMAFKQMLIKSMPVSIKINFSDESGRYVYMDLDDTYLINNLDKTIKIGIGEEVELEFVYDIEDFYKILNNKDNVSNLKEMLSSEGKIGMYMVVRNSFIYPDSISGRFEYHTLRESIDISPLKKFK